jgi:hypothetical protein
MKKILIFSLVCLPITSISFAATVGYWQLDGYDDGLDSILAHGTESNADLTAFGTLSNASAAVDPVPNPSGATWRWQAGDGLAAENASAQSFSGGSGWYIADDNPAFSFNNDSSFTAECWFNTGSANGYIMGNRHADSYLVTSGWYSGWHLMTTFAGQKLTLLADGNPNLTTGDEGSRVTLDVDISRNTWYHAAVVWDHDDGPEGTIKLYLDGVEVASSAGFAAWSGLTGGSWAIGHRNLWVDENELELGVVWGNTGFSGSIDEVRFVDEALPSAQFLNGSETYAPVEDIVRSGDLDIDGDVDLADFAIFSQQWLLNTDPAQPDAVNLK